MGIETHLLIYPAGERLGNRLRTTSQIANRSALLWSVSLRGRDSA